MCGQPHSLRRRRRAIPYGFRASYDMLPQQIVPLVDAELERSPAPSLLLNPSSQRPVNTLHAEYHHRPSAGAYVADVVYAHAVLDQGGGRTELFGTG